MAEAGKEVETGGGGQLGVSIVLQGGGSGSPSVWVGFLVAVRLNDVVDGEIPRGITGERTKRQADGIWET